jgi:O-antigen/teichoic acid export membrane protein
MWLPSARRGEHPGVVVDLEKQPTPSHRTEEEQERLNRQMMELLNELRVAMPGVQVLFGFLLTVPFQQRFSEVDAFQRTVYVVSLIAAATATALLIAPSAYHRMTFQRHEKPNVIRLGSVQFLLGLLALAIAMIGAVVLVLDFLFKAPTAVTIAVALGLLYLTLWFGVGAARRMQKDDA